MNTLTIDGQARSLIQLPAALTINGQPVDNGFCMETIPVIAGTCGPLPTSAQYTYVCVHPLPCPVHPK